MSAATQSIRTSRAALERELQQLGKRVKGSSVACPFHEDAHASASIYAGEDGAWRLKCHVPTCGFCGDVFDIRARVQGRAVADVLREESGLDKPRGGDDHPKPKRVFKTVDEILASVGRLGTVDEHYEYTDPDTGAVQVVQIRYHEGDGGKKFLPHRAVDGGFVLGMPPKPWPIYNRRRVRDAREVVVVVEGEKCVHALHRLGIVATTSPSGAANGDKADWTPLVGKKVYIWPDNDEAGEKYAQAVIAKLEELNPRPEVYRLNVGGLGLGDGGDAADFIADGATAEEVWVVLRDGSEPVGANSELQSRIADIASGRWRSFPIPGFPQLSAAARPLFPGTIMVKCADPAASKSLLLLEWMYRWHCDGIAVALYELEEDRSFHLLRLLAMLAGTWDVLDDAWGREHADALTSLYEQHRAALDAFSPLLYAAPIGQLRYLDVLDWIEARCKAGAKIIGIDPITAVATGEARQIEDLSFVVKASTILRDHGARLILVTHPRMGSGRRGATSQDDLAGGRAFSRHTQTVLWVHRHDPPKKFTCATAMGNLPIKCNRSIYVAKARNGPGHGWKVGMNLGPDVRFAEQGLIVTDVDAEAES